MREEPKHTPSKKNPENREGKYAKMDVFKNVSSTEKLIKRMGKAGSNVLPTQPVRTKTMEQGQGKRKAGNVKRNSKRRAQKTK